MLLAYLLGVIGVLLLVIAVVVVFVRFRRFAAAVEEMRGGLARGTGALPAVRGRRR